MFDEDDLKSTRWRRLRHYKARIRMWSYNVSRRITTTTCVFLGVLCILLFLVVFTPKLEVDLIPQKASISGNNKLTASLLIEKKGKTFPLNICMSSMLNPRKNLSISG
jgi:hypothetical protein